MLIATEFCNKYGKYSKKASELSKLAETFADDTIAKFGNRVPIAKIGAIMMAATYDNHMVKLPFYYHKAIYNETVKFCQTHVGNYYSEYFDRYLITGAFSFSIAMTIALEA